MIRNHELLSKIRFFSKRLSFFINIICYVTKKMITFNRLLNGSTSNFGLVTYIGKGIDDFFSMQLQAICAEEQYDQNNYS